MTDIGGGFRAPARVIRALKVRRLSGGRLVVVARLAARGDLHVKVRRGAKTIRRARRTGKRVVLRFRSVPSRALSVRVAARAAGASQVVVHEVGA